MTVFLMTVLHESHMEVATGSGAAPKVVGVISSLTPGGAEHIFSEIMAYFSEKMPVAIIVLQPIDSSSLPLVNGIRVTSLHSHTKQKRGFLKWFEALRVLALLRQQLIQQRPDVVVSFMTQTNLFVALASFGLRMRRIFCERLHPSYALKKLPLGLSFVQRGLRNLLYRLAEKIVLQSHSMKSDFPPSLAPRLVVIPNFIRGALVGGDDQSKELGTQEKGPRILWVGRLVPQKDARTAIRAFAQLLLVRPEAQLTMIGSGPEKQALDAEIHRLALQSRISCIPYTRKIEEYYRQSDILLSTSRFEGFPNVILEAMNFGLPVIATDCPGATQELVRSGQNGFLAPCGAVDYLANYLKILAENGHQRAKFGKCSRESAAAYDRNLLLHAWLELVL